MTLEAILLGGISALTGAVVYLFKKVQKDEEECKKDRKELWETIFELQKVSCNVAVCPARQKVNLMRPAETAAD